MPVQAVSSLPMVQSVLKAALIERLNGTFRERLTSLTRTSRHAARRLRALETGMYLIGCSYNFCFAHHELSKANHWGRACTPAMTSGLTDHVWSVGELLTYKLAPPDAIPNLDTVGELVGDRIRQPFWVQGQQREKSLFAPLFLL